MILISKKSKNFPLKNLTITEKIYGNNINKNMNRVYRLWEEKNMKK